MNEFLLSCNQVKVPQPCRCEHQVVIKVFSSVAIGLANCVIALDKAQTHFHQEHGIDLSSDFLAFGDHLVLRLSVSHVANRCCHTVFVNPENPGLLQWEFHPGHCWQCHPHHGSECLSNLPSRAWLKTSTRLFSSIAAKCLRVCRFFLQQQSQLE